MIKNLKEAANIAMNWHGGQWRAFYQFASSMIFVTENRDDYVKECNENLESLKEPNFTKEQIEVERVRLTDLKEFFEKASQAISEDCPCTWYELEVFILHYLICALWSSNDNSDPETGGEPIDSNYDISDLDDESMVKIKEVCRKFLIRAYPMIKDNLSGAGHDFFLTTCESGAGFTDGGWGSNGKVLYELCKDFPVPNIYVNDNGTLYFVGDELKENKDGK